MGSGSKAVTLTTITAPSCMEQRTLAPAKGWPDFASRFWVVPISRPDRRASSICVKFALVCTRHCTLLAAAATRFFCTLFCTRKIGPIFFTHQTCGENRPRPTFPPTTSIYYLSGRGEGRQRQCAPQGRASGGGRRLQRAKTCQRPLESGTRFLPALTPRNGAA